MTPRIKNDKPANLLDRSFAKPASAEAIVEKDVIARKAKTAQGTPRGNPFEK
jgi:hypothetical protein